MGRTLDYLETREEEFAQTALAYHGYSYGSVVALPVLAMEERFVVAVLWYGGLSVRRYPQFADAVNYAPRVTIPALMLNGKYDYLLPTQTSQQPLSAGCVCATLKFPTLRWRALQNAKTSSAVRSPMPSPRSPVRLNGKYDYLLPTQTSQQPLYDLLGAPKEDKRYVTYEAGHADSPRGQVIRETLNWLDRYLGPIN